MPKGTLHDLPVTHRHACAWPHGLGYGRRWPGPTPDAPEPSGRHPPSKPHGLLRPCGRRPQALRSRFRWVLRPQRLKERSNLSDRNCEQADSPAVSSALPSGVLSHRFGRVTWRLLGSFRKLCCVREIEYQRCMTHAAKHIRNILCKPCKKKKTYIYHISIYYIHSL